MVFHPQDFFFSCGGFNTNGTPGSAGGFGKAGGVGGSSILRSATPVPYVLIGDDTDTFKGPENIA